VNKHGEATKLTTKRLKSIIYIDQAQTSYSRGDTNPGSDSSGLSGKGEPLVFIRIHNVVPGRSSILLV
jgi:hypothetical protein